MRRPLLTLWLCAAPLAAAAQEPLDSAARADSIVIAAALVQMRADSLTEHLRRRVEADSILRAPVAFGDVSATLSAEAQALIGAKAWLLYFNAPLRLTMHVVIDSLGGDIARDLARARTDSIRRVFDARAIELSSIQVAEARGSATEARLVGFSYEGLRENSVLSVPPPTAVPPPKLGLLGLRPWDAGKRYRWGTVRIFYATDRGRTGSSDPEDFYNGRSSSPQRLEFGRLEVSVPRIHRDGVLERPVWYKLERSTDPNRHMIVRRVDPLAQDAMMDSLRTVVARSEMQEALVFIHGYNVSFTDAALRTAQLTYDMGFDGAPILYSWPSRGSVFRYGADKESALDTAPFLEVFLDSVVAATGGRKVNVIAHSMGSFALTQALERLASRGRDTLLNTVVLAAADIPADRFERLAPLIAPLMRRLAVYMSATDWALIASRLNADRTRLGEATSPMLVVPGVETIDATGIRLDLLGHGYVASSSYVIDDLVGLINRKLAPPRLWLKPMTTPAGARYWRIP